MSPLSILYQDDELVVVDKPAGQLVHPAEQPQVGDEVTLKILRDQLGQNLYLIHRLDRPTCGVLLFAKHRTAARALTRAFERRQVEKIYKAVINGSPSEDEWKCERPLSRSAEKPEQDAVTEFRIERRLADGFALLEARPQTGRYHQIRRHLAEEGYPIVGDYRYSDYARCEEHRVKYGIGTRMLLQACSLRFPHPLTKESMTITAPLAMVFETFLAAV